MAFVLMFKPTTMDGAKYDEIIRRLEQAGAGAPAGRMYHVCYEVDGGLRVTDVFDSMENFERFGQILIPILQDMGIEAGEPTIYEAYNIIHG